MNIILYLVMWSSPSATHSPSRQKFGTGWEWKEDDVGVVDKGEEDTGGERGGLGVGEEAGQEAQDV